MPIYAHGDFDFGSLSVILDQLPAAVTVFDLDGKMLYYNETAPRFVNRKPEHLGQDIRNCHKHESSNKRIDEIIEGFEAGIRDPFNYTAKPYGEPLSVTVVPYMVDGRLVGCIHHVVRKQ